MTSTSGNCATGLKKCRPMKRSGESRPTRSSSRRMLEVFVASSAPAGIFSCSDLYRACLASRFSNMASMMRSAFDAPAPSTSDCSRSVAAARSASLRIRFSNSFFARPMAGSMYCCSRSCSVTVWPRRAHHADNVSVRDFCRRLAALALELVLQEKDSHEIARRARAHELGDGARLGLVTRARRRAVTGPQVDDRVGSRIMFLACFTRNLLDEHVANEGPDYGQVQNAFDQRRFL